MRSLESEETLARANDRFRRDVARFGLRFRCGSCAHVVRASESCSLGYPNHVLKGEIRAIEPNGDLAFCKYFELGETDGD